MQIFSRMDGWIWGVYFFQPCSIFQIYQIWINWSNQSDDCIWQQVHWQLKACISTEHTIIWNSPMFYLSHIWDQSENISLPLQICTKAVVTKLQVLHQTMNFSLYLDSMNQESSVSCLETRVPAWCRLHPFFTTVPFSVFVFLWTNFPASGSYLNIFMMPFCSMLCLWWPLGWKVVKAIVLLKG